MLRFLLFQLFVLTLTSADGTDYVQERFDRPDVRDVDKRDPPSRDIKQLPGSSDYEYYDYREYPNKYHEEQFDGGLVKIDQKHQTDKYPVHRCPSEFVSIKNLCINVSDKRYNWFQARHHCELLGGYLAFFNTLLEFETLAHYIERQSEGDHWLGIANVDRYGYEAYGRTIPFSIYGDQGLRIYLNFEDKYILPQLKGYCITMLPGPYFYARGEHCNLKKRAICLVEPSPANFLKYEQSNHEDNLAFIGESSGDSSPDYRAYHDLHPKGQQTQDIVHPYRDKYQEPFKRIPDFHSLKDPHPHAPQPGKYETARDRSSYRNDGYRGIKPDPTIRRHETVKNSQDFTDPYSIPQIEEQSRRYEIHKILPNYRDQPYTQDQPRDEYLVNRNPPSVRERIPYIHEDQKPYYPLPDHKHIRNDNNRNKDLKVGRPNLNVDIKPSGSPNSDGPIAKDSRKPNPMKGLPDRVSAILTDSGNVKQQLQKIGIVSDIFKKGFDLGTGVAENVAFGTTQEFETSTTFSIVKNRKGEELKKAKTDKSGKSSKFGQTSKIALVNGVEVKLS